MGGYDENRQSPEVKATEAARPTEEGYFEEDGVRCLFCGWGGALGRTPGPGASAFGLDLTERKAGGRSLREAERRYARPRCAIAHDQCVHDDGAADGFVAHEVNQADRCGWGHPRSGGDARLGGHDP